LWAVGIRSGILGNVPFSLDTEIEQIENIGHDDFDRYRYEERFFRINQLQSEERSRFYRAVRTHLITAIGILDRAKDREAGPDDEMEKAFKNEINELMKLVLSPNNVLRDEHMESLEPFLESSAIFRFGSLSEASERLHVLTDFVYRLKMVL
jgi:hypothetical protein